MGTLREAQLAGERVPLAPLVRNHHLAWTINGVAVKGHVHEPVLTLKRNSHHVLSIKNDTDWPHPIHLHRHILAHQAGGMMAMIHVA